MIRRIEWFEGFTRPRGTYLFAHRWSVRVIGLILMTFAAVAALAPPFSGLDTIPSMGAVTLLRRRRCRLRTRRQPVLSPSRHA